MIERPFFPHAEPRAVPTADMHRVEQRGYQYGLLRSGVQRLMDLNLAHARRAWRQRRSDPVSVHIVALVFVQPRPGFREPPPGRNPAVGDDFTTSVEVKVTQRRWLAGPENRDLAAVLFAHEQYIEANRHAEGWSLRERMVTSIDPGLRADATWVGLAVSSLDTYTGSWEQVCATATHDSNVPGTIRLVVNVAPEHAPRDYAWIVADRRGLNEFGTRNVYSTHRLSDNDFTAPFPYSQQRHEVLAKNHLHATILQRMTGLNQALAGTTYFARPQGRPPRDGLWRYTMPGAHGSHP